MRSRLAQQSLLNSSACNAIFIGVSAVSLCNSELRAWRNFSKSSPHVHRCWILSLAEQIWRIFHPLSFSPSFWNIKTQMVSQLILWSKQIYVVYCFLAVNTQEINILYWNDTIHEKKDFGQHLQIWKFKRESKMFNNMFLEMYHNYSNKFSMFCSCE